MQRIPKLQFALFYVNSNLTFCVPYTEEDTHYIDEMLKFDTVPIQSGKKGKWIEIKQKNDHLCYYADYSVNPNLPKKITSRSWNLLEISNEISKHGEHVILNHVSYNFLNSDFEEITGISKKNYLNNGSFYFKTWLDNENIQYRDNVHEVLYSYISHSAYLDGSFEIQYSDNVKDAIDFLKDYDIVFEPTTNPNIWKLREKLPYNINDNKKEVKDRLYPISKLIPSRDIGKTKYSKIPTIKTSQLDRKLISSYDNSAIIELFNAFVHPECKFIITNENEVKLCEYCGKNSKYEIPTYIKFSENSKSYRVTGIGEKAFFNNDLLTEIEITNGIEYIQKQAFCSCKSLSKVTLDPGIEKIGDKAFYDCEKLEQILIPHTVKYIGSKAFSNLKYVTIKCQPNAFSNDSLPLDCLIQDDEEKKQDQQNNESESPIEDFICSLAADDKEYLKLICNGEDTTSLMRKYNKNQTLFELSINTVAADCLGETDGIFEDGQVFDDYVEDFQRFLSTPFALNTKNGGHTTDFTVKQYLIDNGKFDPESSASDNEIDLKPNCDVNSKNINDIYKKESTTEPCTDVIFGDSSVCDNNNENLNSCLNHAIYTFIDSLDENEKRFIDIACNGKDTVSFYWTTGISSDLMSCKINEKFSNSFDTTSEFLFENKINQGYEIIPYILFNKK